MAEQNNPLRNLLAAGVQFGGQWAGDKLFGSEPASNAALQVEKVERGQINGSGPVNARASILAPSTWTDFFFGSRAGSGSAGAVQTPNPIKSIGLAVVAGLIVWWIVRK